MKKVVLVSLIILVLASCFVASIYGTLSLAACASDEVGMQGTSDSDAAGDEAYVVDGEVIVGFKTGTGRTFQETIVARYGGIILDRLDELSAVLVKVDGDTNLFINEMQEEPTVGYVEPNGVAEVLMIPNDPLFQYQWGPNRVDALNKWDTETGNKSVVVAVVDTGVDYNHPDLDDNYIATGYDFINNDNDPMDDNGHGTHCAGIVAAEMNNSIGVAGIANVSIMAVKVLDYRGYGTWWTVSQGITWAADNDACIISLSLGGRGSSMLENAVNYAYGEGCLLIAAAGNNYGGPVLYPAAYPNVTAISAIDGYDNLVFFSNKGPEIELTAPGDCILSTYLNGTYVALHGTSMAAPHVSGVAALVWSQNMSLSNVEVRAILQATAHDIGDPGWDEMFGYGVVDADTDGANSPNDWTSKYEDAVDVYCIMVTLPDLIISAITWDLAIICPCDWVTFTATVTNGGNGYVTDSFDVRFWVDGVWIGDVTVTVPPNIAPGGSVDVPIQWHADEPCDHIVEAYADWWNDVDEWDELNNGWWELFEVQGPDLIVEDITWDPALICPCDDVTFTAKVTNVGLCPVNDPFDVDFWVDNNWIRFVTVGPPDIPIPPGGSVDVPIQWHADEPCDHTVKAIADWPDVIKEHPDAPNDRSELFEVQGPDLIVEDITWQPEEVCPCENITFTAKVTNIGKCPLNDTFDIDFFIDDEIIYTVRQGPPLPPGSSVIVQCEWHADEPCWHTIKVWADQPGEVEEHPDTEPNWLSKEFEVQGPDLIVKDINWEPALICPCDTVIFTANVTNLGKCNLTDSFDVDFFIDDELICTVRVDTSLSPNASVTVQCEWHADEPCWHTVEVWADLLDEVKEHPDTEPNWLSKEFEVQGPDLIVSALGWMVYDWICPCDNITFWALIRNVGLCNLTDPFVVGSFVDGESVCNVTVTQGLQAGATVTVNCTWHADKPCNHTIRVVADPYDEVKEHPDQPNYMEETFEVQGPDLIVEDIDWIPKTIYPCNTVTFTATVTNIGLCDVNDSFVVRFWVDGNHIGDKNVNVPPRIPPSGFVLVSIDWHADIPCFHTIRVYADWWNNVKEHPDQTNDRNETFKVIGPPCIGGRSVPIDLPVNKVTLPASWITHTLTLSTAFAAASITTLHKKKHKTKKNRNKT